MSSSPSRPQTGRTTPKRTALAERTQSQANEISARLSRPNSRSNTKAEPDRNVYSTSPFPTKASHVLLPSTVRKQKSSRNLAADLFAATNAPLSPTEPIETQKGQRKPQVKLKRSVKTLRDLYEAQAEESSRPGTAISRPGSALGAQRSRPGTANSRLRSASSSEALSGRYVWEQFRSVAADDLALLPLLPEGLSSFERIGSPSSFAARIAKHDTTSSPNFPVHGAGSSPKIPIYRDLSELSSDDASQMLSTEPSSAGVESSPNVLRLGRTSSADELSPLDEAESIPSFYQLATSSPARTIKGIAQVSSPPRPTSSSSTSSRKRKRDAADSGPSFAARAEMSNRWLQSPSQEVSSDSAELPSSPTPAGLASSPPMDEDQASSRFDESSPVIRVINQSSSSSEQLSVVETHSNLQAALSSEPAPSSSPMPAVQYPVVRAPAASQVAGISIPKKVYRASQTTDSLTPRWPARLSANASDVSINRPRTGSKSVSKRSSFMSDGDDYDMEPLPEAYILSDSANNSQIRIVPDSERHEGEDEVTALPGDEYGYRSPPPGPNRGNSYFSGSGSSRSRLNSLDNRFRSMASLAHSRHDSLQSLRPESSSSMMSTVAVPTWARRYYSGFYPDSFKYLAHSTSNVNLAAPEPQVSQPVQRPESLATSRSSRPSFQSLRQSLSNRITSIVKNRPRLEARKSHIMPGIGPLVSNPVRGPATAALETQQVQHFEPRATIRPVSLPLDAADPRSQWSGVMDEDFANPHNHRQSYPPQAHVRPPSASTMSTERPPVIIHHIHHNRLGHVPSMSPHLHHDHRLNTGSTASRGFGHPFNRKSNHWSAPSLLEAPSHESGNKLRNGVQIICFLAGFVFPLTWFLGALLPLPARPDSFSDIEKHAWQSQSAELTNLEEHNVLSRLRAEKMRKGTEEVAWQNTRWWRTANRWMCIVGGLVLLLVIVLGVIGTRKHWSS